MNNDHVRSAAASALSVVIVLAMGCASGDAAERSEGRTDPTVATDVPTTNPTTMTEESTTTTENASTTAPTITAAPATTAPPPTLASQVVGPGSCDGVNVDDALNFQVTEALLGTELLDGAIEATLGDGSLVINAYESLGNKPSVFIHVGHSGHNVIDSKMLGEVLDAVGENFYPAEITVKWPYGVDAPYVMCNQQLEEDDFTGDGAPPECTDASLEGRKLPAYCGEYGYDTEVG